MLAVTAAAGLGGLAGRAVAHPDPNHNIEAITQQIAAGDRRPALFYARSIEYRALDKLVEAEADLRQCLTDDPAFLPAKKDLALVLVAAGKGEDAVRAAREAVALAEGKAAPIAAGAWSVLAKVEMARKNPAGVLEATTAGLKAMPRGEIDWFLMRAECFRALGKLTEAIDDLKRGHDALKSTILRNEWLDALIDAGRGDEALPVVEQQLQDARFRAGWLIRRARILLAKKQDEAAKDDLHLALGELDLHIRPDEPDPTLLVERGMVFHFLGEREKAAAELERADEIAGEPALTAPLARLLAK